MNETIEQMADNDTHDDILSSSSDTDDFEKMLNDFIAQEFGDEEEEHTPAQAASLPTEEDTTPNIPDDIPNPSELIPSEGNNTSNLNEHEYALFRAYKNFMYALSILCEDAKRQPMTLHLTEDKLLPHYKKRAGAAVTQDILLGWDVLMQLFPEEMHSLKPNSSDDDLLDFAEQCENENLQLGVISYVETMIELEGCEIDYEARKLKFERRQLEKQIYEEHQQRVARVKRYIDAIKAKQFPIDAEKLVNNYFRLSNKDPEGSFKALTTNPATFAPIDFSKIKARFFGLIKVRPQDGIRINQKIGEFLKKLKV